LFYNSYLKLIVRSVKQIFKFNKKPTSKACSGKDIADAARQKAVELNRRKKERERRR
jgi:hypothetical protein